MEVRRKRYLVFGFDQYYPGGGLGDIIGECETMSELMSRFRYKHRDEYRWLEFDVEENNWTARDTYQVLDLEERKEVDIEEILKLEKS